MMTTTIQITAKLFTLPAKAAVPIETSGVFEYLQVLSIRSAAGNRDPTD